MKTSKVLTDTIEAFESISNGLALQMEDTMIKVHEINGGVKQILNKIDDVDRDIKKTTSTAKTYAESLKSKKVLIVKSTQNEMKAVEKKKEIMRKIKIPVETVNETKDGHLIV